MQTAYWFLLVGGVLLLVGLGQAALKRLPVTSAMIYLAVGLLAGPTVLNQFHFNPLQQAELLEWVAEVAVLLSLFTAGSKLSLPWTRRRWWIPLRLAFVSVAMSVALVAAFGHGVLGMSWGAAVLLGAILAPTDPVLATEVQVRHPGDHERLRFGLTGEAGFNDGSAFPFVMLGLGMLGLHEVGDGYWRWWLVDLIWATVAGLGFGWIGGWMTGHVLHRFRGYLQQDWMPDFLSLGFIAVIYGATLVLHGYGFLAVFVAAVTLRQTEHKLVAARDDRDATISLSEHSRHFNEQLERLSELVLVILLGGSLFIDSWTWRALAVTGFVFMLARPIAVAAGLWRRPMPRQTRDMISWFGVRGIGSLYYLMYAINHGLPEPLALELLSITLIVVTLSILLHGVSVGPLMLRYDESLIQAGQSHSRAGHGSHRLEGH